MKITFGGKYVWNGIFIDEDDEEVPFGIFADTFDEALGHAKTDIPGEIIALSRGKETPSEGIEAPEWAEQLFEAHKKRLN